MVRKMPSIADSLLPQLLPTLVLLYLFAAPYTKVEESFNIQATHDILHFPTPEGVTHRDHIAQHYDHVQFPGSVPRTFTGAFALAEITRPFTRWLNKPEQQQITVRAILGLYNAFALWVFSRAVFRTFGSQTAKWYIVLQASQFHIMFYASRTLPNMFAFGLTTMALRMYMDACISTQQEIRRFIWLFVTLLTFTATTFRSEVAILLATHAAALFVNNRFLTNQISSLSLVWTMVRSGFVALSVALPSVIIDSLFWGRTIWPEWEGFYYNTILGKSSEWGISPWHYYFSNAVPRLLLNPFAIVCIATALMNQTGRSSPLTVLIPSMLYIAVYSVLPHKEWRFIIYTIPSLTAVAAYGATQIWNRRRESTFRWLLSRLLVLSVLGAYCVSGLLVAISSLNYPGGEALTRLHSIVHPGSQENLVSVHLDNLSCQTGVTRFLQYKDFPPPVWVYDKSDDKQQLLDPTFWASFDYALAEDPERVIGKWDVLDVIYGFGGVKLLRPSDPSQAGDDIELHLKDGREIHAHRPQKAYDAEWYKQLGRVERLVRPITRGWWVQISMVPRIWILKQAK